MCRQTTSLSPPKSVFKHHVNFKKTPLLPKESCKTKGLDLLCQVATAVSPSKDAAARQPNYDNDLVWDLKSLREHVSDVEAVPAKEPSFLPSPLTPEQCAEVIDAVFRGIDVALFRRKVSAAIMGKSTRI